jgi:FkbM family methyltransferase
MPVNRLRDQLSFGGKLAYLIWRATGSSRAIRVKLRSDAVISIRPAPSDDLTTAFEVFVSEVYGSPRHVSENEIDHVVDLGANVGYSSIFLASRFPHAHITAFEPHPDHAALARENFSLHHALASRIELFEQAAGIADGLKYLTNAGVRSTIQASPDVGSIPIAVVDILDVLRRAPCDLLKIDIEGSEYEILASPRFHSSLARVLVVEWHPMDGIDGENWIRSRLQRAGYGVERGVSYRHMGILWGYADAVNHSGISGRSEHVDSSTPEPSNSQGPSAAGRVRHIC